MSTLPKIPLDSSSDLTFLRLQLQQALSSRLHRHLPNALPEDSLRTSIESHIARFLSATMQEASGNVLINGLAPRPSDIAKGVQVEGEVYETFDAALQNRVLSMHAELESTITRVTQMRRDVPQRIKALSPDPSTVTQPEPLQGLDEQIGTETESETVTIVRESEVIENYERSVKLMKQMKGNVGTITEKVQRAKDVLVFIQSQQSKGTQE